MLLLVFGIAAFCVCVGFGLAAVCERRNARLRQGESGEGDSSPTEIRGEVESAVARELLETLKELTASVDDNVDRHSSSMTKITRELDAKSGNDASFVLAAASQLLEANKQLQSDLDSAKAEMRIQERELNSYMTESRTDELTGLGNRRAFEEELRRRLAQWQRQGVSVSLILLDIDRFKWFNDFYGHPVGDAALQQVAASLGGATRQMDLATRYGGEEFAIILNGTELEEAKVAAERFREAVLQHSLEIEGNELHVSISAGVAQAGPEETRDTLIKRADDCLYAAKKAGRNRCYYHDGDSCRPITACTASGDSQALCLPARAGADLVQTNAP